MKKLTKPNLIITLQSLVIIYSMFFATAFAGQISAGQVTAGMAVSGIPAGEYAFMSVTSQRRDGSPNVNTNVHGSLILKNDGTYEHTIYIGNSPGGCGPGTYRISGDTLRLIPAASTGCNAADWKFIYDAQMNRLSLRDDNVTLLYCVAGKNDCF